MAEEKTSAPVPEVLKQTVREIPIEMLQEEPVRPVPAPEPEPQPVPSFNLVALDAADLCRSSYEGEEVVVDGVTFSVQNGNWSAETKENAEIMILRRATKAELQDGDIIIVGTNRYVFSK